MKETTDTNDYLTRTDGVGTGRENARYLRHGPK